MSDEKRDIEREATPARRLSSIQKMKVWGIIQSWLSEQPGVRRIELDVGAKGMRVILHNPLSDVKADHERQDDVGPAEDPHRAIMRVLSSMGTED